MTTLGDDVLVVSGLPRSGTSLVMQVLAAGGVPVLTDGVRRPDAHNPRGYLELAAVKATARDATWLDQAPGKAVKVVLPLLELLPPGPRYRVLLVTRDLREVALSQARMVGGDGDLGEWTLRLSRELTRGRRWLATRPGVPTLEVEHAELLARPREACRRLCAFVGGDLDLAAMARVVDPSLHRALPDGRPPGAPVGRAAPCEDP